jgi:hypothetical protein
MCGLGYEAVFACRSGDKTKNILSSACILSDTFVVLCLIKLRDTFTVTFTDSLCC